MILFKKLVAGFSSFAGDSVLEKSDYQTKDTIFRKSKLNISQSPLPKSSFYEGNSLPKLDGYFYCLIIGLKSSPNSIILKIKSSITSIGKD